MHDCGRLATEALAVLTAAARAQARCETLCAYLANNMDPLSTMGAGTEVDCRFHHLVLRVQSIMSPMPELESAEG